LQNGVDASERLMPILGDRHVLELCAEFGDGLKG
jgi:hypothetical protein